MNIYIENDKEIRAICEGSTGRKYPVGDAMDIFDHAHKLRHDDYARAQYMEYLHIPMSRDYEKLLHPERF